LIVFIENFIMGRNIDTITFNLFSQFYIIRNIELSTFHFAKMF